MLVYATEGDKSNAAIASIAALTKEPEVGDTYTGRVVKTTDFMRVRRAKKGTDGLPHVSNVGPGQRGSDRRRDRPWRRARRGQPGDRRSAAGSTSARRQARGQPRPAGGADRAAKAAAKSPEGENDRGATATAGAGMAADIATGPRRLDRRNRRGNRAPTRLLATTEHEPALAPLTWLLGLITAIRGGGGSARSWLRPRMGATRALPPVLAIIGIVLAALLQARTSRHHRARAGRAFAAVRRAGVVADHGLGCLPEHTAVLIAIAAACAFLAAALAGAGARATGHVADPRDRESVLGAAAGVVGTIGMPPRFFGAAPATSTAEWAYTRRVPTCPGKAPKALTASLPGRGGHARRAHTVRRKLATALLRRRRLHVARRAGRPGDRPRADVPLLPHRCWSDRASRGHGGGSRVTR